MVLVLIAGFGVGCEREAGESVVEQAPEALPEPPGAMPNTPLRVLSYRPEAIMAPLMADFTTETGIEIELLVRPGEGVVEYFTHTPAEEAVDLIVAVDSQRFAAIAATGALRPLPLRVQEHIPARWRDESDRWAGLGWRVRAVLQPANQASVGYAELPQRVREGAKVCVRDPEHVYNTGLLAWLYDAWGEALAEDWRTLVLDQRQPVPGGDRAQIDALVEGRCDYAVVNHYYVARHLHEAREAGESSALVDWRFGPMPSDEEPLYTNFSGMAVTAAGANHDAADQLAIWLSRPENQSRYAEAVYEFPAAWPDLDARLANALADFQHLHISDDF